MSKAIKNFFQLLTFSTPQLRYTKLLERRMSYGHIVHRVLSPLLRLSKYSKRLNYGWARLTSTLFPVRSSNYYCCEFEWLGAIQKRFREFAICVCDKNLDKQIRRRWVILRQRTREHLLSHDHVPFHDRWLRVECRPQSCRQISFPSLSTVLQLNALQQWLDRCCCLSATSLNPLLLTVKFSFLYCCVGKQCTLMKKAIIRF